MYFFNIFKKKDVPDELPDLFSDEIARTIKADAKSESPPIIKPIESLLKAPAEELESLGSAPELRESALRQLKNPPVTNVSEFRKLVYPAARRIAAVPPSEVLPVSDSPKLVLTREDFEKDNSKDEERSFFNEVEENLVNEIKDLEELENWYKNKFLPQDTVMEMRKYWEKEKTSSVVNLLGKNFKEKIGERTKRLQDLEREWQNIYFELVEKEEEIREEERELKKVLAEFVEICKRRKDEEASRKFNPEKIKKKLY